MGKLLKLTLATAVVVLASNVYASPLQLLNEKMRVDFDDSTKSIIITDLQTRRAMQPNELFFLMLPNEKEIHMADFQLDKYEKDNDSINLKFLRNGFTVDVSFKSDKDKYVSINYKISALNKDRNLAKITFFPTKKQSQAPYIEGSINSSPIIADSFFMLPRKPIINTYAYEASTNFNVDLATPLTVEAPLEFTIYIGTFTEIDQLRRDFNKFMNVMRPRRYEPYLHYNTFLDWVDNGSLETYTEANVLNRMDAFYTELVDKRGVKLDGFLLDGGWDDHTGRWNFGKAFEHGFGVIKNKADAMKASVGLWLSPWGGYNKSLEVRISHAKKYGFETVEGKFALSGPNYFKNFNNQIINLITNEHISSFKLDGMGNANTHLKGSPFASDFDASIVLLENMRKANPNIFINLTTGTNASPSWLFFADSIWRQGDDINLYGEGSPAQQWMTYRDAETYRSIVRQGPLFPLNSLMYHGIVSAQHAYYGLEKTQSDRDFSDQVWSYFSTGTQLQEMYITPNMLNKEKWDVLADAAKWSRANAKVLTDTHWIGGNPTKLEVYGWASWTKEKAVFSLRNPSEKPQVYFLDLPKDFELPTGISDQFIVKQVYGKNESVPRHYKGATVITLSPLQTLVLEAEPL
ncbi:enterotoxin [Vibrio mimicus]